MPSREVLLDRVLLAWQRSGWLDASDPPLVEADFAEAERRLARSLPPALRRVYAHGGPALSAHLESLPLLPEPGEDPSEALTVATAATALRGWDWPVPDEMVLFAVDGGGDYCGLWLPRGGEGRPLAVQIGETFEPRTLAIVGDDLAGFLAGWTAYSLLQMAEDTDVAAAVAALELPDRLVGSNEDDDDAFYALLGWANPHLPDRRPDPYERGLTAEQVTEIARRDP